jgi:hypothetical protein
MLFLFPVGRSTALLKFPWATTAIIALTSIIFFLTWPAERRFLNDRVSTQEAA